MGYSGQIGIGPFVNPFKTGKGRRLNFAAEPIIGLHHGDGQLKPVLVCCVGQSVRRREPGDATTDDDDVSATIAH
jgi:hypothetical protein